MRLKIKLEITTLPLVDVAITTTSMLHKILGLNNKWHDLVNKPFTCSLIKGGKCNKDNIVVYNDPHIIINTEDMEVVDAIMKNISVFDIEIPKIYKDCNILSVKNVIYNSEHKKNWITESNKEKFIEHINTTYKINAEILKIKNSTITYKNGKKLPVSDLLIKIKGDENVGNLFESGIGGSCSIGFGFVDNINIK